MTILQSFGTPGGVPDSAPAEWSDDVNNIVEQFGAGFPQFYNPTAIDTPDDADVAPVVWSAFPGSLTGPFREQLETADGSRGTQDEYCEWAVERNGAGKITRVTFTTEVPEFWKHLFATDRGGLLALYQELIDPGATAADLEEGDAYVPDNGLNNSTIGRPAHLIQGSNSLTAAVKLAAEATILREDGGIPVTGNEAIVACGALGVASRNSDPSIAGAVNAAAATGAEITLADPPGLYIAGLITGSMQTPDGADPQAFWHLERGEPGRAVRAFYEVPEEENRGYAVGDILVDGQRVEFGGQLALRVRVRLDAVVKPGDHQPERQRCVG
jgi:hypothetical protein